MKNISVSRLFYCFLFFLLAPLANMDAQNQRDMDSLLMESERLLYIDPVKSLIIDDYILKESTDVKTKVEALLLQSQAYLLEKDYTSSLSKLQQAQNIQVGTKENNANLIFNIGLLYQELQLSKQADELIKSIENSITTSNNFSLNVSFLLYQAQNEKFSKKEQLNFLNKAKQLLNSKSKNPNSILQKKYQFALAEYFFKQKQYDTAIIHLQKLNRFSSSQKDIYDFLSVNKLAEIALIQNNAETAKELLELNINEKKFGEKIFTENYKLLSQIYFKENNLEKFALYQQKYVSTLESQNKDLQEARVNAVNFYGAIKDNISNTERTNLQVKFFLFCIPLLLIILLLFLHYFKTIRRNKKMVLVLENKKEIEKAINDTEQRVAKENVAPVYSISEKTEQAILDKLENFEKSLLFTDSSLTMQALAIKLNTNTKYLSDVINNKKNKNFKTYLNELRIGYITEKLKSNPAYLNYKTSYLAKESGFTSRSSFTVIFKNIVGVPPSVFIEKLRDEKK